MINHLPLVEKLFARWRPWLGEDFEAYHHHVYRLINLVDALTPALGKEDFLILQVAAAFHDLGIWRGDNLDYLEPSADEACAFLARNLELGDRALEEKQRLVRAIVYQHHRLRPIREQQAWLAEAFRKAHWTDLSLGLVRFSVSRKTYRQFREQFPWSGFHRRLLHFMLMRLRYRPLSPLPMLRL